MSNIVTSLLRSRNLGVGLTGKALMLFMGDLASDDGSGIWAAKARMARELETTDRTVQRTIDKLIGDGFVIETGRKKHRNGYTFEYQIDVDRVAACPESKPEPPTDRQGSTQYVEAQTQHLTPDTLSPPTHRHPTPDTLSPHAPTQCHPNPIEPQEEPEPYGSLSSGDDLNSEPDEIQIAVDQFNAAAEESGWPTIRILSKSRRSALAARLRECGGLEGWAVALAKAQASPHCCGQNDRGWVANFDFITRQSSFVKLMEGNYDNRNRNNRPQQRGPSGYGSGTVDAFAEVARRRAQANA